MAHSLVSVDPLRDSCVAVISFADFIRVVFFCCCLFVFIYLFVFSFFLSISFSLVLVQKTEKKKRWTLLEPDVVWCTDAAFADPDRTALRKKIGKRRRHWIGLQSC